MNKMETSQLMNCRLPKLKVGPEKEVARPLNRPANELCVFKTPLQRSWHRSPVKQQDQVFPPDPPRVLELLLRQPSLGLLTDAQLDSDGPSTHVPNGAGIKAKAGGSFMFPPTLRPSCLPCLSIGSVNKMKHFYSSLHSAHVCLSSTIISA